MTSAAARDDSYKEFVLDQLSGLGELNCRAMFGGYGLYHRAAFFAIIFKDRLYFKTGPESRKAYVKKGMQPFMPNSKQTLRTYYEVPIDVIEDREELGTWARQALHGRK